MFGFLFKLLALGLVLAVIWALLDIRWVGNELRIRSRFAQETVVEKLAPPGSRPPEHHPEKGRRQIEKLIQENDK